MLKMQLILNFPIYCIFPYSERVWPQRLRDDCRPWGRQDLPPPVLHRSHQPLEVVGSTPPNASQRDSLLKEFGRSGAGLVDSLRRLARPGRLLLSSFVGCLPELPLLHGSTMFAASRSRFGRRSDLGEVSEKTRTIPWVFCRQTLRDRRVALIQMCDEPELEIFNQPHEMQLPNGSPYGVEAIL